jgi:restriction system protein
MPVPDFQTLMLPLLKLAADGQQHTTAEAIELLAQQFQLSEADRAQVGQTGDPRFNNRVRWAMTYLKKAGLLQSVGRGRTSRHRHRILGEPLPRGCRVPEFPP